MIVAMVESPAGVAIAGELASVPGVDVVFVASTDLSSFSGLKQGDPKYEAMVTQTLEAVTKAGKKVAGPLAWKSTRKGYSFFQGPSETSLIRTGVKVELGMGTGSEAKKGVAPTEGSEKH
jgi:4-hydroxy-2-oxoheptanedioate aldolase